MQLKTLLHLNIPKQFMKKIFAFFLVATIVIYACTSHQQHVIAKYLNEQNLLTQNFLINTTKDTTLITRQGLVVKVAANSIEAASSKVTIEIKEALTIGEMLKAGLTTQTANGVLSSEGMFKISTQEKSSIKKPLQIEVPTTAYDKSMQLYKGAEADGKIVWENPTPITTNNQEPDGKNLFEKKCASCHALDKNLTGPALAWVEDRWSSRKNLIEYIKNCNEFMHYHTYPAIDSLPSKEEQDKLNDAAYADFLACKYNYTAMNIFKDVLTDKEIVAILDYIKNESKHLAKPANLRGNFNACKQKENQYVQLLLKRDALVADNGKMVDLKRNFSGATDTIIFDSLYFDTAVFVDKVVPPNYDAEYYKFTIDTYGWYNVDALLGVNGAVESKLYVNITKAETKKFELFLIIPSLKIFTEGGLLNDDIHFGFYTKDGKMPLPQNIDAYIMAMGEENDKTFFALQPFTTSANQTIHLEIEETSKEKILRKLKRLNLNDVKFDVEKTKNYNDIKAIDQELKLLEQTAGKDCECFKKEDYTENK